MCRVFVFVVGVFVVVFYSTKKTLSWETIVMRARMYMHWFF